VQLGEVVETIAAQTGHRVGYEHALTGGRTVGAHLVSSDGVLAVLKFGGPSRWLVQIRQAAITAEQVRTWGYPTPRIWAAGELPDGEWWYLQDFVTGTVLADADFGDPEFDQVLELLRSHRGKAPATRQDWSGYTLDTLFGHGHEWAVLVAMGPPVCSFLRRLTEDLAPLRSLRLATDDLVLGDLCPENLIFRDGRIAGVIDFGCAGRGDSLIDGVYLMMRFRDRSAWLDRLRKEDCVAHRAQATELCGAANVLRGLHWQVTHGEAPDDAVAWAEGALSFYSEMASPP
jgi:aminoglycoside phosphotransferase (APT) family kinase protein